MNKNVLATLFVITTVFFSACAPLEEPPGSPTMEVIQNESGSSTSDSSALVSTQLVDGRFYEKAGVVPFSYAPPEGWTIQPSIQGGLTSWLGPEQSTGKIMLRFLSSADTHTAKEALQEFLTQIPADQMDIEILQEGEFTTQAGGDAYRIKLRAVTQADSAIAEWYVFANDGFLITATYYRLDNEDPEQDAIIDASMETLQFEK